MATPNRRGGRNTGPYAALALLAHRTRGVSDVVPDHVATVFRQLDAIRDQAAAAPPAFAQAVRGGYDTACSQAGPLGSAHRAETDGQFDAVKAAAGRALLDAFPAPTESGD